MLAGSSNIRRGMDSTIRSQLGKEREMSNFTSGKLRCSALLASALLVASSVVPMTSAAYAQDKKPVIRYVFKFSTKWWPPEIDKKIQENAARLGVDYEVVGPENGDIAKQVEMIENYVSDKVDALVVSSLGPATCQAVDDAIAAGVPVVMGDGDCSESTRLGYYGSNNLSLGADAATLFAEAVKDKGHQRVLVVTGTPGAQNLQEREQGFKDKVKDLALDVEFLPTIPCYEDTQKAIDAIESSLRADPSITAVYVTALWPFQASAASLPLMTAKAKEGKLVVVNVDAFPNGLKLVEDGYIYGQVSQNLGQLTAGMVEYANQVALNGVKYPSVCNLANQLITKDGGSGRISAAEFNKKIWTDFDWDTHPVQVTDCQ
ncbi:MAG: sugar ABC transporter substrate-binding protein [Mesorhizobium sp.]|nr:MAG: sugar ABC transporter substrate-binding protein [Mesorhizobium sp.]